MHPKKPARLIKKEKNLPDSDDPDESAEVNDEAFEEVTKEEDGKTKKLRKKKWEEARRRTFCGKWLNIPEIREWVHPVPSDPSYVWCKVCRKKIRAHLSDMRCHSRTKKHKRNSVVHDPQLPSSTDCLMLPDFSDSVIVDMVEEDAVNVATAAASIRSTGKEVVNPASLGFIGCGNMAQALLGAFIKRGLVDPPHVTASAPSNRNLTKLYSMGVQTTHDNNEVLRNSDVVFICVKPHMLTTVVAELETLGSEHNPLFVSVVTGHDLDSLEEMLGTVVDNPRVIRTMPNTPSLIGQGCCVYTLGTHATSSDGCVMQSMLSSLGVCAEIPESQMDAACGLAGSGPAYIYAAIEALSDGGVKMGLPRHLSQMLAAQMVKGAASMVLESGKHPAQLKDEVCSPGGTTISAMHTLEKCGLRNALISAVEASALKSKELGSK